MGVLNFSTDNLITGVNIIEGQLYWTDDRNEPKKIDIERWKMDDITIVDNVTQIDGEPLIHDDITVIRPHPFKVIDLNLEAYRIADVADQAARDLLITQNQIEVGQQVFVVADDILYQYQGVDGSGDPIWITASIPEPPFERIFPRFSYRWRYEDGQYSPYAPFTQAAFLPRERRLTASGTRGDDNFIPTTEEANYLEGYNTTMYNNVGKIILDNIPRGGRDVVAIDLLYTESISTTIYVLETINIPEAQRGQDSIIAPGYEVGVVGRGQYSLLPLRYEITSRKIFRGLPADQLARDFDNVPRLAKAQEVTANRLVYGNYLQRYDQPDNITMTVNAIEAESQPFLYPDRYPGTYAHQGNTEWETRSAATRQHLLAASFSDGLHVKGNRSYEIGVAYIDAFGRIGGLLQTGSTTTSTGEITEAGAFRMPFRQFYRQQLVAQVTSLPPAWADKYRYYIKDVSMDHHNLVSYNVYNDGSATDNDSDYIWLEFQSTDRNKIIDARSANEGQSATVLVLKRTNNELANEKQRFLVQDIQNEAPADVRNQLVENISNVRIRRLGVTNHNQWSDQDTSSTSFGLRDVVDGVNFQVVADVWNNYLQEYGLQRIVHPYDSSTAVNHNLLDPMVDGESVEVRPLFITFSGSDAVYYRVTSISDTFVSGRHQINLGIGNRYSVGDDGEITDTGNSGLINPSLERGNQSITLYTDTVSDAAIERLGGRFWVRTARNGLQTIRSQFSFDGELETLNQLWFETEPVVADSNLDLFWETSQTFCVCTDHGYPNKLNWANCIAEVLSPEGLTDAEIETEVTGGTPNWGPYLESTRINDQFNSPQLVRGVRANIPSARYAEERRIASLIHSGLYNSRTGVNNLNEFNASEGIVKNIEPNYGSIQKLHTRNTNLVVLAEDKVFNVLADKDLLFNADGGGNIAATAQVLGQTTAYVGEYGIGTAPESFASYGHQAWFADPVRGSVIQFTPATGGQSQLFEISGRGMNDVFRDRLFSSTRIWGMFDDYTDKYILSLQEYNQNDPIIDANTSFGDDGNLTFGYEGDVEGWSSRFSFIPEGGFSLNNKFYTFKLGQPWQHNSNSAPRNNFYGEQYTSRVEVIFNDNPSTVKEFLAISYEGSQQKIAEGRLAQNGWAVIDIDTVNPNREGLDVDVVEFIPKEDKYFAPILQTELVYQPTDDEVIFDAFADDGVTRVIGTDARSKGGMKGFFAKVILENDSTEMAELFAVNTEYYQSSN